jgi:DNA-binding NtrC family response regulator
VLFVDDDPRLVQIAEDILGELGFRVSGYTSPRKAVEAFRAAPSVFDAVVTDHTMPELDGIGLATELTALRHGVPILLASGYAELIPASVLEQAGIAASLPKPYDLDSLANRIHESIEWANRGSA